MYELPSFKYARSSVLGYTGFPFICLWVCACGFGCGKVRGMSLSVRYVSIHLRMFGLRACGGEEPITPGQGAGVAFMLLQFSFPSFPLSPIYQPA